MECDEQWPNSLGLTTTGVRVFFAWGSVGAEVWLILAERVWVCSFQDLG